MIAPMPARLAIRSRLVSDPGFTGDITVEVSFQRRDFGPDLPPVVRVFPVTHCAFRRGVRERAEGCLKVSRMIEFIVVTWWLVVR